MSARAALAACALLAAAASPAPAEPAPAPTVVVLAERSVPGFEAYDDAVVLVAGTVRVTGSLRIRDSQIVMLGGAVLLADGALDIEGSTIEGGPASIEVAPGGILATADVSARGLALRVRGEAVLQRTTLSSSPGDAIVVSGGGELEVLDLSVSDPRGLGIRATESVTRFTRASVRGALGYGVQVTGGLLEAEDLQIWSAADYGLRADNAEVIIEGGSFRGHCGVFLGEGARGRIAEVSFATSDHGLTLYGADAVALRGLSFDGGSVGLAAYGSTIDAASIVSSGVEQSIVAMDAGGSISGGWLGGGVGVEIGGAGSAVPIIRSVDLSGATTGVMNRTSAAVDARWNFWGGEPNTAGAARADGSVLVAPWLASAPS